jgi:dCMP deaminase
MRPTWDQYFISKAYLTAMRSTCLRKAVGAIIVDHSHREVASGYNGAPAGMEECLSRGCLLKEIDGKHSCIRTIHAEKNALNYAGKNAYGCVLYTTVIPCYDCAKDIINVGIHTVVYDEYYESRNTNLVEDLFKGKVVLRQYKGELLTLDRSFKPSAYDDATRAPVEAIIK